MALFVNFCWSIITSSLIWLCCFMAMHLFRIREGNSFQKDLKHPEVTDSNARDDDDDESEEKETPSLSFKFQYQLSDPSASKKDEPSMKPSVDNLGLLSENDFNGFTEGAGIGGIEDEKFLHADPLEEEKPASWKSNPSTVPESTDLARFLSEFSGFESDTESLGASDGYSVKDLIVDSDSDGLLSERDVDEHEHQAEAIEVSINATKFQAQQFEDIRRFEETELRSTQSCDTEYVAVEGELCPFKNHRRHIKCAGNGSDNSEPELDQIQKIQASILLPVELIDSSDDELHATEKHSSSRKGSEQDLSSNEAFHDGHLGSSPSSEEEEEEALLRAELDELEEELGREEKVPNQSRQKEDTDLENSDDEEDYDDLESLWEHQDLMEELKLEMRRLRAVGLPTILEESEAPKAVDDPKPWKIHETLLHEDPMDELHKFYKSYRVRMRKLDILNYQKMYAIGLLQLKDPLQSMKSQRSLIPTLKSLLPRSLWPRGLKPATDLSEEFIKELQSDLEMVYVGQTCLSWEFLLWQYEKAREMPQSARYRNHQYNQVAEEFQQFQVIMQRFIEDEVFKGPRLPDYVKHRCGNQNLPQVPHVREDNLKEKMEAQLKGNRIVCSDVLEEIMEESIRVFWEFVKADKDETPWMLKGLIGTHVQLQDPADFNLMANIQSNLQKKEKKLKDILRIRNCLVKKLKKPKEDRSNQDLFFSQVDLRLVARVLRMSRITTEQLVWCHTKLSNIVFIEGKVHREPSFLLFPC
ncbi:hypothetical protein OPV22_015393 [Ensete ventricosum]|uniref:Ribosomal protein L34Ae n=1 Tax=Ensete ventricosum TaxID=4639 RepID=A0AAV8R015_ENSVE|nr:hypothetical protein OPV22_015393 [Ensete ventricosum]